MSILCFLSQYLLLCRKPEENGTLDKEGAHSGQRDEIPKSEKKERGRMCGRPS